MSHRLKQSVNTIVFKYFSEQYPNYLNEVFDVATESNYQFRGSFQKLKCPFHKTNSGQLALSCIVPTFWKRTLDTLKRGNHLNSFKHTLKSFFLSKLKNSDNSLFRFQTLNIFLFINTL